MSDGAKIGIVAVVAVLIGFPLLASLRSDLSPAESESEYRYKQTEFAARMNLNDVPRERYKECPFKQTYEETLECLGAEGVEVMRVEDIPRIPIDVTNRLWERFVRDPDLRLYAWVNEYDEIMVTGFQEGESVTKYAGQPPPGMRPGQ